MVLLMLGSLCVPLALLLCQLLLSQALSSESMSPDKHELLRGAALPSPHGREGGPGLAQRAGDSQGRTPGTPVLGAL